MHTVLLIHNDSEIVDLLKQVLESLTGFDAVPVTDINEGLEMLQAESFSCVVLGHQKSHMNGKKFLQEKGKIKTAKYIPVILDATTNNDTEYWKDLLIKGCITAFLPKLCNQFELQGLLHEICVQKVKNEVWQRTLKEQDLIVQVVEMPLILRQAQDFLLGYRILQDHKWSCAEAENQSVFCADVVNGSVH